MRGTGTLWIMVSGMLASTLLPGCSVQRLKEEVISRNRLQRLGIAYQMYWTIKDGRAPQRIADLESFLEEPELVQQVKMGDYEVIWGVTSADGLQQRDAILAFEAQTPHEGGYVLLVDGTVHKMTAREFAAAPRAAATAKQAPAAEPPTGDRKRGQE